VPLVDSLPVVGPCQESLELSSNLEGDKLYTKNSLVYKDTREMGLSDTVLILLLSLILLVDIGEEMIFHPFL